MARWLEQLEQLVRTAAVIANDDEFIIIGSQSILGAYPRASQELLVSAEADVYAKTIPSVPIHRWQSR